jgi:hypothetical protein
MCSSKIYQKGVGLPQFCEDFLFSGAEGCRCARNPTFGAAYDMLRHGVQGTRPIQIPQYQSQLQPTGNSRPDSVISLSNRSCKTSKGRHADLDAPMYLFRHR